MEYLIHILILIGIYVILSVSLNLIAGYTGLLSIAHATFYGVGAYVAALMAINLQSPFLLNLICAIILSGMLGALVGIPSLRIRDDFFVITTFAFQVITYSILNNWVSFTGGPMGLPGIPQPTIFGLQVTSNLSVLILVAIFCTMVLLISDRIARSPFGRVLKAIREDEVFAQAAGKNIATYKVLVFVISAGMAAVAGVMYAYYVSFIDPTSFTVMESVFIISIVIIGGAGSLWGPVVGSVLLVVLPELLRFIGLPSSASANLRQIIYGGLLIAFMMWRPRGLLGEYAFQVKETRQ
ncbi:branched-chain amino acid ABC transporter permease [Chlorobium sp. BLA1]|uniref:branched-chain amino acid ABC transporter permease n=1 Tax=Candidatus Chlorobium masyuteum TaxID=2716876 RepID=UPI001422231C|nr:branched-chain amino acid ABC transporter permease [Candidatus Chlorobium masyuteum]NHQ59669.1 branched-chain amino acid ABC transporter permease [Candidatus Chlorobium masyuteum]